MVSSTTAIGSTDTAQAPYRRLWLACFLGYIAIGATIQVMPEYVHTRMGAGDFAAGLAVTIGSLATMLSRPIAGRITDRQGGRGVALVGAVLSALGGLGHLLAPNLPCLVAARLLLGAGEGALFTAAIGWVLASTPADRHGRIAGHFGLSMWGGLTGGPILGAALLAGAGFRTVWIAAGLLPLIGLALAGSTRGAGRAVTPATRQRRAWLPRAAWRPSLSYIFASIGYGVIAACLVPRFAALGLAGKDIALAVFGIAFLVTRFLGSPLVDRFGAARMLVVALLIEAAGLGGQALADTTTASLLMTAVTGIGIAVIYPCYVALVTRAADPGERTAALGVMISAWDLGVAAGGPIGGLVAGEHYAAPFATAAAAALAALVLFVVRPARAGGGSGQRLS
jgi:MFS family permease